MQKCKNAKMQKCKNAKMQKCGSDLTCQSNTINKFAAFSNKNSFNLDDELKDNSLSVQELKKKYIENTFALAERPYWASYLGFDVMQNDLAKQYVQYWNSQDLAKIDTQTPSWIKFSSWISDPENQLLVVSGGYLVKGLSDFTINYFSRNSSIKTISAKEIGMKWYSQGGGINTQGMSWEDAIAKTLPDRARLPKNFKTFDFYNAEQKVAISAKSLDTQTLSKLNEPKQIYNSIKGNIDKAANFKEYELSGIAIDSKMIAKREIWLAVPETTTKAQWIEINRAASYGQSVGIEVKITQVK
ncbi:endonuclease toxin domain-containing protein [Providencia rettgeri]